MQGRFDMSVYEVLRYYHESHQQVSIDRGEILNIGLYILEVYVHSEVVTCRYG